jgi:F420H(2)-dependent biliverdin reductase
MAQDITALSPEVLAFLSERHLATLTTLRADGSPHVVPVGFSYDPTDRLVRIITAAGSVKARNAARGGRAAVSQVDGPRWLTLEGTVSLATSAAEVQAGESAYASRYQQPRERSDRVVIHIQVDKIMGRG